MRQCPRFPALFTGTLVHQHQSHPITRSMDLSRKGCRLKSTAPVAAGMTIDLLLYVPGEDVPLLIQQAMVRWSSGHGIGIEFPSLAFPHQERLDTVVRQCEIALCN